MRIGRRIIVAAGVLVSGVLLIQGAVYQIMVRNELKSVAVEHLTQEAKEQTRLFSSLLQQARQDLSTIQAHKSFENFFTSKALDDYDGMLDAESEIESFFIKISNAKPQYTKLQLASATGEPILQINMGRRTERFDRYDHTGALKYQKSPAAVVQYLFMSKEDGWVLLSAIFLVFNGKTEGLLWTYQPIGNHLDRMFSILAKAGIYYTVSDGQGAVITQTSNADPGVIAGLLKGALKGWIIVTEQVPELGLKISLGTGKARAFTVLNHLLFVGLVVLIAAMVFSILVLGVIARSISSPIRKLVDWSGRLSVGDLAFEDMKMTNDETGELNTSYRTVVSSFREVASVCESIANGDFSKALAVKSEKDVLGISVNRMIEALRKATEESISKNEEIEWDRRKVRLALDEISSLIQQVTIRKDFDVRFSNPNLKKCYEIMDCSNEKCPCYGKGASRCWQLAGADCDFGRDFDKCSECPVFREAVSDPIYQIGEHFNNMMHILEVQHKELEKAYTDLKAVQSQILQQEKMASIGQLAAGIAHEINNPTGFIMSNLGTLQKYSTRLSGFIMIQSEAIRELHSGGPGSSEAVLCTIEERKNAMKIEQIISDLASLIGESMEGAERIKKIVQDLKSFSRVDEAEFKMSDINAGLESTINIVWNELKYKAMVKKELGDIPSTKCNLGQLNQVFMNLLVNASHAIEKQGEIAIKTWSDDGHIRISISDTGSGIPKENINRIFDPFFTTKEIGKGTGLGLSIAYDIVKKHKGEINVQSEMGKGTTFSIQIPIIKE